VSIVGDMPQYFVATAYLLDNYDNSPLCTAYSTPMYTKEMQDLLASTVDDYDPEKVLNLDQDKTTNFAVYGDSVVVVKATAEQNILESVDADTNEYLFRKADDALLGLKRGAILAYEDADGELLALRVYSITSDAKRSVLLKGFTPEVEDVFAHVKIESSGDTDDIVVDESTGDPGITYTGRVSDADTAARGGFPVPAYEDNAHASLPLGFDLSLKLGNVSLTGSLQTSLTADLSYYITFKRQFISFTLDTNTTLSASVSGEAELLKGRLPELGFAPVPGVFIGFAPEIQVKATGTIAFNAVILRKIGFSYEVGKGSKDLSTPSVVQTDLTVSGVFFVGIDFCPKISILKDTVAAIKLTAPCGVTLTAVLTGTDHGEIAEPEGENGPARVHLCKNCLDIDVSGTFSLALELEFLKSNSLKYTVHFVDAKYHIRDYYYSVDQDDFGTGSCPYGAYRTTVSVLDEAGSGVDKVQVMAKRTSDGQMFQMGTTNPEGVTTEYLTPGVYHFTGTAGDVEYSLSKRIYTAGKVVMEPRPKATQPTMPPFISSVVTTETVKDKTNSKVQETGSCGTNVTYTLYSDGLLEIEGDGDGRIRINTACEHNFERTKSEENLTRPENGNDGYYTYTCANGCGETEIEYVKRADYTEYSAAHERFGETINKYDFNETAIDYATEKHAEMLEEYLGGSWLKNNYIESEQYILDGLADGFNELCDDLIAGAEDGTFLNADYTEIDKEITALEELDVDGAYKEIIDNIKAELEELKADDASTQADVYQLLARIEAIRNCEHICHSGNWFLKILWSIANFFCWLFKIVPTCACGMTHY